MATATSFLDNLLANPSPRNSMLASGPILDPLAEQAKKIGTEPFKAPPVSNLARIRQAALDAYKPTTTTDTTGGTTGGAVVASGAGTGGDSSGDTTGERELTEAQVMEGMRGTSSGEIEADAKNAVENLRTLEKLKGVVPLYLYVPLKAYYENKKDAYTYESGMSYRFNDKDVIEKYSDDNTVRMQDIALFGGYYDKDGKFIVVNKAKAELSQPKTDIENLTPASETGTGAHYQEGTVVLDGSGNVVTSGDGSPVLTGKGAAMVRNGIDITIPMVTGTGTMLTGTTVIDTQTGTPITTAPVTGPTNAPPTTALPPAGSNQPLYTSDMEGNGSNGGMLTTNPSVVASPVVTAPIQPVTPIAPIYGGTNDSGSSGPSSDGYSSSGGGGYSAPSMSDPYGGYI